MKWFEELKGQFYTDNDSVGRRDVRRLILEVDWLRDALDGPIRKIAYDVKQGGVLGDLLLEEIAKALRERTGEGK